MVRMPRFASNPGPILVQSWPNPGLILNKAGTRLGICPRCLCPRACNACCAQHTPAYLHRMTWKKGQYLMPRHLVHDII